MLQLRVGDMASWLVGCILRNNNLRVTHIQVKSIQSMCGLFQILLVSKLN
jgi:hypothetical protein